MFEKGDMRKSPTLAPFLWFPLLKLCYLHTHSFFTNSNNPQVEEANFVASRTNKFHEQSSAVEIAVIVNDVVNRPPRFLQAT